MVEYRVSLVVTDTNEALMPYKTLHFQKHGPEKYKRQKNVVAAKRFFASSSAEQGGKAPDFRSQADGLSWSRGGIKPPDHTLCLQVVWPVHVLRQRSLACLPGQVQDRQGKRPGTLSRSFSWPLPLPAEPLLP